MSKSSLFGFFLQGMVLALAGAPSATAQLFPDIRSIPSESMLPTLLVGDRVEIKHIYKNGQLPRRGEVVVFQHPNRPKYLMIDRVIGLPGDTVQMKKGKLILNGKEVAREPVRQLTFLSNGRFAQAATEYAELLPGAEKPHRIFEFSDSSDLDHTPAFKVPPGHFFLMGDNRDNSEDSRAPTGHRKLAAQFPEQWPYRGINLGSEPRNDAIGFVPIENVIGRATSVVVWLGQCTLTKVQETQGVECLRSNEGKPL